MHTYMHTREGRGGRGGREYEILIHHATLVNPFIRTLIFS